MITFQDVFFSYVGEEAQNSLPDINLTIPDGQVVLITGSSGCGKSTLLRLINGLAPHFYEGNVKGKVLVDGKNPSQMPLYEMAKKLGSVFQNPRAQFYSVDTNGELAFVCENQGMEKEEILKRVECSVQKFRIEDLLNRNVFHLSGGQKQRGTIACAFASNRNVLLFDEPTSGLDLRHMEMTANLFRQLAEMEKTVIVVTHDSELINCCCYCVVHFKGAME